jgi:NCS1 family nucleobase:cation symporter-1
MEQDSKVSRALKALEVRHEPGLTDVQLMLTNEDLKPVEPARRQWGAWHFVAFWTPSTSTHG